MKTAFQLCRLPRECGRGGPGLTALTCPTLRLIKTTDRDTLPAAIRMRRVFSKNALFVALLMALTSSGLALAGEDVDFFAAAQKGNLDKVKVLLKANPDLVFVKIGGGNSTPLAAAANHGHKDVVEFLLANNADINAKDCHGETALNAAAGLPCKDVAELLLANGAEFTIHDVASLGDMDKVKSLLKANPELVFSKNQSGMTPLHCAVWRSQQDTVEFLLVNKADVNARDKWNATPLHFAATKGIVELLLANKAEVNARDYEGLSPLGIALEGAHHPDLVKLLRQHGGNDLWTDFLHAIKDDRLGDFNALLKDNPDLAFSKFGNGKTFLHLAAENGRTAMAQLLLDNKADVNAKDNCGATPLNMAAYLRREDVAKLLRLRGGHE